jgi:hypothetical protein
MFNAKADYFGLRIVNLDLKLCLQFEGFQFRTSSFEFFSKHFVMTL